LNFKKIRTVEESTREFISRRWVLLLALAIGAVARLAFVFLFLGPNRDYIGHFLSDSYYYDAVATTLLENPLYYTSALHPPLYSVLVAIIYAVFGRGFTGFALTQIFIDLGSLVLFWKLCSKLVDKRFANVCAVIYALYPDMIYFTGQLLPGNLFIFILLLTVNILYSLYFNPRVRTAAAAGISFGLTALTWGGATALLPFLPVWLWIVHGWRNGSKYVFYVFLFFAVTLSPWVVRNYIVWKGFIPICTGTAGALVAGNSPESDGRYYKRYDLYLNAAHPEENEYEKSKALTRETFLYIWVNPWEFVKKVPNKLYFTYYWELETASTPGKRPMIYNIIPFFSYGIFIPALIAGLVLSLHEAKKFSLIYFIILSQVLVVIMFFGHTRLRSQIMHYFIIFGVLFFFWLSGIIKTYLERKRKFTSETEYTGNLNG
jgi:hypothetical protein